MTSVRTKLATRLSYAIWGSTPDQTLLSAAGAGQLSTDAQVKAQVTRMLADPRASALLDEFAGDWLDFSSVESHSADPTVFPAFTPALAHSMRLEARSFIRDFLESSTPVAQMFSAGFTYIDANLATQYGLPSTPGTLGPDGLWRVATTGSQRVGLLTLGSLLTTTSNPDSDLSGAARRLHLRATALRDHRLSPCERRHAHREHDGDDDRAAVPRGAREQSGVLGVLT